MIFRHWWPPTRNPAVHLSQTLEQWLFSASLQRKALNRFILPDTDFLNWVWRPLFGEASKGPMTRPALLLLASGMKYSLGLRMLENSGPSLNSQPTALCSMTPSSVIPSESSPIRRCHLWYLRRLNPSKTFPKSIHASHWVDDAIQPSHPPLSPSPPNKYLAGWMHEWWTNKWNPQRLCEEAGAWANLTWIFLFYDVIFLLDDKLRD